MEKSISIVNVLWTGGYDSTFRMIQLSKKEVTIQPYYLSDNRRSEANELNAIAEISIDILNNSETKSVLLPLIICATSDIKADDEITEAYKKLRKVVPLGSQYDWLPRFAKERDIKGLELSLEKAKSSIARICIAKFGEVKLINNGLISYYIIDREKSDLNLFRVFGNFNFPNPLYNMTKKEMLEEYKSLGFEKSINKTWFCFFPINKKPCGLCNPCKSAISEGMEFRFPKLSLRRYKYSRYYAIKNLARRVLKRTIKWKWPGRDR